jgi:monoterpene epsilon-lactone hydrolase
VRAYLNGHDAGDPFASPLLADLAGLPPVRVHVGADEVLLDDSRRFVESAVAAGVDIELDV